MNVTCFPSTLRGTMEVIPSKSDAHRKLICAALSENHSFMHISRDVCDDILATMQCLESLGATFTWRDTGVAITPLDRQHPRKHAVIDCNESGSTFRFLLPVAAAFCNSADFSGSGRLPTRPISALTDEMTVHGVSFSSQTLPFSTSGILKGGKYEIAGNISSQFLTGLFFALPQCETDSEIHVNTELQSRPYIDMTLSVLKEFGISIEETYEDYFPVFKIRRNQKFIAPTEIFVDGDWSNAAFWCAANTLGSEIDLTGLSEDSPQGDKAILSILRQFQSENSVMKIDIHDIPDLLPILAVVSSTFDCETQFLNAKRLRYKESDRLTSVASMIRAIGGNAEEHHDSLTVYGGKLKGGTIDAQNDHRLAMAAAIAALKCENPVTIIGAEAVKKSYPRFFSDYQKLGGVCDGIHVR